MKQAKRKLLEEKGWRVGSTSDFLGLSEAEVALIDLKIALGSNMRERRKKQGISQVELAKLIRSSQSRIAKMESGDPTVTLDLLVKSLIALGASRKDVAKVVSVGNKAA